MKKNSKQFASLLLFSSLLLIAACSKKDKAGSGQLMIVNASPAFGPVDVNIDSKLVSGSGLASPGNTAYFSITEGPHPVRVLNVGGTTNLLSLTLTTVANKNQSLYIYDRPSTLQEFAVMDDYTTPPAGQANIRFFNLAPGTPALDIGTIVSGNYTLLFPGRAFEVSTTAADHAVFTTLAAGTYSFNMRVTGAGASLVTVDNVVIESGKTYTLYSRGISGSLVSPLGLTLITH